MAYLRRSLKLVNSFLPYVLFLGLCGSGIMAKWPLPGLNKTTQATVFSLQVIIYAIISFFFYPIIYGRMVETIRGTPLTSTSSLLKNHFLNYFIFSILLVIPSSWLPFYLAKFGYITNFTIRIIIYALIHCLAIFMLPLIFMKRRVFSSIYEGFLFFIHNVNISIPLILLTIFLSFERIIVDLSFRYIYRPANMIIIIGIGFFASWLLVYLQLLIFTDAAMIIKEQTEGKTI